MTLRANESGAPENVAIRTDLLRQAVESVAPTLYFIAVGRSDGEHGEVGTSFTPVQGELFDEQSVRAAGVFVTNKLSERNADNSVARLI